MKRSLVLHAHFYQPPREDPLLDEIEPEASAAPYHDWNQRIERECYRAVVAARIPGAAGRIRTIVNTLECISFNVGPTLFEWMERHASDTYRAILAADRRSCERLGGHGNAIAHPYHHVILPLASRRDKVTEVRWGIMDFRRRFGREPEGMWLPETAVDDETLDVLAQERMRFAILAPHQVTTAPLNGLPGRYRTAQGRDITLCIYDGDLSHGIAFGGLVRDATLWWKTIEQWPGKRRDAAPRRKTPESVLVSDVQLISAATDGETYGHHHRFAEMALARVLERAGERGVVSENFASFTARHPPTQDLRLVEPTSWSCAHGVERWRSNCGCRMDGDLNPSQAWRTPLRDGLDALATRLHQVFGDEAAQYFEDPWAVRDAYGSIVGGPTSMQRAQFMAQWLRADRPTGENARAWELLEMERDAMRMFTSCAWFFDDIGGIEPRQVLKYALRAASLAGGENAAHLLEDQLAMARSNSAQVGTGADVFRSLSSADLVQARVAGAACTLETLGIGLEEHLPSGFDATVDEDIVTLVVRSTGRVSRLAASLVHRSSNDLRCEVRSLESGKTFQVWLADFPERSRHVLRRALRQALLPVCLTAEELQLLASGEVSLRGLVGLALTRSVAQATTSEGVKVAMAAVDLFEQLETKIPFDAQTAFWRLWTSPVEGPSELLRSLGLRLGFDVDELASPPAIA